MPNSFSVASASTSESKSVCGRHGSENIVVMGAGQSGKVFHQARNRRRRLTGTHDGLQALAEEARPRIPRNGPWVLSKYTSSDYATGKRKMRQGVTPNAALLPGETIISKARTQKKKKKKKKKKTQTKQAYRGSGRPPRRRRRHCRGRPCRWHTRRQAQSSHRHICKNHRRKKTNKTRATFSNMTPPDRAQHTPKRTPEGRNSMPIPRESART